jgi:hypothetical protein
MNTITRLVIITAALVGLTALTVGATGAGNPDETNRTGAANDGGTSGPGSDNGASSGNAGGSGSGCSKG